jgi:hypothetical protein
MHQADPELVPFPLTRRVNRWSPSPWNDQAIPSSHTTRVNPRALLLSPLQVFKAIRNIPAPMLHLVSFSLTLLLFSSSSGPRFFNKRDRLVPTYFINNTREVIEELDTLQTGEQLLFLLGRLVQQCSLAQAKSPFILIPSEPDFKQLLQDVDHCWYAYCPFGSPLPANNSRHHQARTCG